MSVVKITAILLVSFLAMLMKNTSGSAVEDYKWCAYKLFMKPETWAKAKAVCEANGMTLAHITDTAQHAYLTSYVTDQLKKQNPDVQTEAWIGLRKDAGGAVRLDNCNMYAAADYNPIQNLPKDCVYFDAVQPTFMAEDCASSKAFLCQAPALDLNDCFTYKEVSLITQGWNFKKQQLEYRCPEMGCCSVYCTDNCVAFTYGGAKCTFMTRHYCPCALNGYYTVKGVLNTEDHSRISAGHIDNFCGGADVTSPEIPFTSPQLLVSSSEANIQSSSFEASIQASSSEVIFQVSSSLLLYPASKTTEVTSSASPMPYLNVENDVETAVINSSPDSFYLISTAVLAPTSTSGTSVVLHPAAMIMEVTSSASSVPYLSVHNDETPPVINSSPGILSSAAMLSLMSTSVTSSPLCSCSCGEIRNETLSMEELQQIVEELKSQLSVNKKGLSSWKRKLTSAPDKEQTNAFLSVEIFRVWFNTVYILS